MSTKIFVHRPLKRAELRKLQEPTPAPEAIPEPPQARREACDKPKIDMATRAANRATEQRLINAMRSFAHDAPMRKISLEAFSQWMGEMLLASTREEAERFVAGCNLSVLLSPPLHCFVCAKPKQVERHGAFVIFEPRDIYPLGSYVCAQCAERKPQLFTTVLSHLLREIWTHSELTEPDKRRLRAFKLGPSDKELFTWLAHGVPPYSEALKKHMKSGNFYALICDIQKQHSLGEQSPAP